MTLPHGRYQFSCDITDPVLEITLVTQFECEVDIETSLRDGEPECTCTAVYVDGEALQGGSALSRAIRLQVMDKAEAEIEGGGHLWDLVRDAERLVMVGAAGSPDVYWEAGA